MQRLCVLMTALLFAACSGSSDDGTGDGTVIPTMCGVAGVPSQTECAGLSDCGRGSGNFVQPMFCDNCPPRADSHVCESGVCRETMSMNIDVTFVVPAAATGAESFTITSFNPIMADGGTLTCAALRSSCTFVGNEKLNAANSRASPFSGGADPAFVYTTMMLTDVGTDRLLFIQAVSDRQGKGNVMAVGCVDGIEAKKDEVTAVSLDLTSP